MTNENIIDALNNIMGSEYLTTEFNEKFPKFSPNTLLEIVEVLNYETKKQISHIAPTCFNINGKVFLEARKTEKRFDLINDDIANDDDGQYLYELQDITTEDKVGASYSLYVSDTSFFKKATVQETEYVNKFLKKINTPPNFGF